MSGRRAAAGVLLAIACAMPARAESVVPPQLAPLLDASRDRVVERGFVPSPEQKVGEVRRIRRGDADVVQTLLYSKLLARVVAEIRKKETANWPPDAPGHADAERYGEALAQVQQQIWDRMPRDEAAQDRRQKMWIEFVLAPNRALVAVGAFEMSETGGVVTVTTREPLVVLEPSRDYVERNMRLIEADSFHGAAPEK
jgi:hypothetical protein